MGNIRITEAEALQRKSRIIHSAFRLFCQNGIDKVTVKQIAKAAGVAEKSVYRYYNSKLAILRETSRMLWREIITGLTAAVDDDFAGKTGYQQLEILLDSFRGLYEKHADYILFSYNFRQFLLRHSARLAEEDYEGILSSIQGHFISALEKGARDGTVVLSKSGEELYAVIWGLMRGYVTQIVLYDSLYAGQNIWKAQFDCAKAFILSGLKNGPEADR